MDAPLNRHGSAKFNQLFEEDTAEPGSLGDIVEKHAGDAIFLTPDDGQSVRGVDGGIGDFIPEMNSSNEDDGWSLDNEDEDGDALSEEGISTVDITGTAQGLARGFGSHLPQDLGAGGFQIKEIPDSLMPLSGVPTQKPGEELDDYDDPQNT